MCSSYIIIYTNERIQPRTSLLQVRVLAKRPGGIIEVLCSPPIGLIVCDEGGATSHVVVFRFLSIDQVIASRLQVARQQKCSRL
jgi:hypothetical protein